MNKLVKIELNKILTKYDLKSIDELSDFCWSIISYKERDLSENFIREFKNKVNWEFISFYQTLSENFIREFKNKVNWNRISLSQELSDDFIKKFKDKFNLELMLKNNKITQNFYNELKYGKLKSRYELLDFS